MKVSPCDARLRCSRRYPSLFASAQLPFSTALLPLPSCTIRLSFGTTPFSFCTPARLPVPCARLPFPSARLACSCTRLPVPSARCHLHAAAGQGLLAKSGDLEVRRCVAGAKASSTCRNLKCTKTVCRWCAWQCAPRMLTHTHSLTNAHSITYAHTRTRTHTSARMQACTRTLASTHTHARHAHVHATTSRYIARKYARQHADARTQAATTHSHAHKCTRAQASKRALIHTRDSLTHDTPASDPHTTRLLNVQRCYEDAEASVRSRREAVDAEKKKALLGSNSNSSSSTNSSS
jgi:hypothetical protein